MNTDVVSTRFDEADFKQIPFVRLIVLSFAGFLTMLTETVPAGLLPAIGQDLGTPDAVTGQMLTAYAGASMFAAIPLIAATSRFSRRHLILLSIAGVALANIVTAAAPNVPIAMIARTVGGAAAALQWALLAGYAMRLVEPRDQGRALSVAMAGIPAALAVGVPLGSALGAVVSWRWIFAGMATVGILLAIVAVTVLPVISGGSAGSRGSFRHTLRLRGIIPLLACAGAFQLGHMNLYTYIAPVLDTRAASDHLSVFLLVLGLSALVGLFLTGLWIDGRLHLTAIGSTGLFVIAMLVLSISAGEWLLMASAVVWGLALGAAPTAYQAACARIAGRLVDQAQAILVTVFNTGMAIGSAIGGALLAYRGSAVLPWFSLAVFIAIASILLITRTHSLPTDVARFADRKDDDA